MEPEDKKFMYGFLYKTLLNRMVFWYDHKRHTCNHCINYIIDNRCKVKPNDKACKAISFIYEIESKHFETENKWYEMTHLKEKTEWHTRIGNIMFKKDINQLLCENKEVK